MKPSPLKYMFVCLLCSVTATLDTRAEEQTQQQSRIDFGNAYIQGQAIKSGAVYLTNRRKSKVKSLLKDRDNYRFEILNSYYDGEFEETDSAEDDIENVTAQVNE